MEDERYAVADHVVSQLKEHGDPRRLSDEAKPRRGPTQAQTRADNIAACFQGFYDSARALVRSPPC